MNRHRTVQKTWARLAIVVWLLCAPVWAMGQETASSRDRDDVEELSVEGIAPLTGDDDPRVLYILPWQPPTTPRRPRAELEDDAPELLAPVDPRVFEYHRNFRETLNPYQDSSLSLQ